MLWKNRYPLWTRPETLDEKWDNFTGGFPLYRYIPQKFTEVLRTPYPSAKLAHILGLGGVGRVRQAKRRLG